MKQIINYIIAKGYWGVFILVFTQEIGVPNPVFNENILAFAGFLGLSQKNLLLWLMTLTAIAADILGALVLYGFFYFLTHWVVSLKITPDSLKERIQKLPLLMKEKGRYAVFLGRMMPFLRGWVAVGAGITRMPLSRFIAQVLSSACIWTGGWVLIGGYAMYRYAMTGRDIESATEKVVYLMLAVAILGYAVLVIRRIRSKNKKALIT